MNRSFLDRRCGYVDKSFGVYRNVVKGLREDLIGILSLLLRLESSPDLIPRADLSLLCADKSCEFTLVGHNYDTLIALRSYNVHSVILVNCHSNRSVDRAFSKESRFRLRNNREEISVVVKCYYSVRRCIANEYLSGDELSVYHLIGGNEHTLRRGEPIRNALLVSKFLNYEFELIVTVKNYDSVIAGIGNINIHVCVGLEVRGIGEIHLFLEVFASLRKRGIIFLKYRGISKPHILRVDCLDGVIRIGRMKRCSVDRVRIRLIRCRSSCRKSKYHYKHEHQTYNRC